MKVPEPRKLPSGTWFVQLRLGGKSISISALTRKECIKQAEILKARHRAAREPIVKKSIILRDAIAEYIDRKRASLDPSTIQGYEKIQNQYFQGLMDVKLKDIDIDIVNDAIYQEESRISRRGRPLSPNTIRKAWALIATVLRRNHITLEDDPDLPEDKKHPIEILSFEEVYPAIKGSSIELECLLAARLSLSMSEIRGLTKSKSIRNGKLTVCETVVDIGGFPVRKDHAKEPDRIRIMPIPPYIQRLIDAVPGDVICDKTSQTINKRYQRLLEKAGLPCSSFHKLRHTYASEGARLRIQSEVLQQGGGWKTDHTMKRVYTHTFTKERLNAEATMDDYYMSVISAATED
nr:MAG TPA: Integrase [Caudoviricetes sp.]